MLSSKRILSFMWLVFLLVLLFFNFSEATVHNVSIIDFAFVPQTDTIVAGDVVQWTNNGAVSHTSTSNTAVWSSGTLAPGQSFSFQFSSTGSFPYHCAIHPSMTGTIVVVPKPLPFLTNRGLVIFILLLLLTGIWLLRRKLLPAQVKTS